MSKIIFLENALNSPNVKAFLHTIRCCEGTSGPEGYNFIFGSTDTNHLRNPDLSRHPGTKYAKHYQDNAGHNIVTTAAGAYQFIESTWNALKIKLSLPDFSPHSQDIGVLELLSEKNCLQRLINGDLQYALQQAATIWASMPGAEDNQPTKTLAQATAFYKEFGGNII